MEIKKYIFSNELLQIGRKNKNNFIRDRVLTFSNLIVFMLNFVKRSLQLEIYNFTEKLYLPDVTKQAFSKARKNLLPEVFKLLNDKFILEYYSRNIVNTFKKLRILAIDGSTLRLPSEKELYKEFNPTARFDSIPLAKTSILFDVLNGVTLDSDINTYLSAERDLANNHIQKLILQDHDIIEPSYENDLLMFDRGYPSLFLMYYILHVKKHFLMRSSENFLKEITEAVNSGVTDTIISINLSNKIRYNKDFKKHLPDIKNLSIKIRVLVFQLSSGKREIIITSLIDTIQFSSLDIFNLYNLRWNIEEEYKLYKSITELENFSGKTPITIKQDFFATVFACNIHIMLKNEAEYELEIEKKDYKYKYEYKINKNILVGVIKDEIIDVLLSDCDLELYCEKLKHRIKKNLIPIIPNRSFPRIYKRVRYKINRRAL